MDERRRRVREGDIGAKVGGHCPVGHPPTECVNYQGEVQVPGPGGDVGYAGHPRAIWGLPCKFAFALVRFGTGGRVVDRSAVRSPADNHGQPVQKGIGPASGREWSLAPRLAATGGDSPHWAHLSDVVRSLILLHGLEGFLGPNRYTARIRPRPPRGSPATPSVRGSNVVAVPTSGAPRWSDYRPADLHRGRLGGPLADSLGRDLELEGQFTRHTSRPDQLDDPLATSGRLGQRS